MLGLSVTVNHKQKRIRRRAQWVVASGIDFNGDQDLRAWSNVWINPVNHRLTLRPGPMFDAWWTSNTGIYEKYAKASLSGTTSACIESEDFPGAGKYLVYQDASVPVFTPALLKNTGICVGIFADSAGDKHEIARGGWSNSGSLNFGVGWLLWSDGSIDLFKHGKSLSSYKVSGIVGHGSVQNKRVGLMFIPQAGRELLVVSTEGDGFSHVFGDIDEDEADSVITPPEKFWISVAAPSTHFQLGLIQYPSSGYAVTRALSFAEDPTELGDPYGRFFYSYTRGLISDLPEPSFELFNWAYTGPFPPVGTLPDGSPDLRCRARVTLTTLSSTVTPVIYGYVAAFKSQVAWTNDSEVVCIDPYILEASADLCEDRAGRQWTLELKEPEALQALYALGANLPVRIKMSETSSTDVGEDDIVWIDGWSEEPKWHKGVDDGVQRCTWVIREMWSALEHTESQDIWPHDGWTLGQSVQWDLQDVAIGLPGPGETEAEGSADLEFDVSTLILGGTPNKDANDWNVLRDAGVSGASDLTAILNSNAPTWLAQFQPRKGVDRPVFILWSPETQASRPVARTLYLEKEDAIAAGDPDLAVWELERSTLRSQATEVILTWRDPRTGRIHQEKKRDEAAAETTLAPSARPANWWGMPVLAGEATDLVTRVDVAESALEYMFNRFTAAPEIGESRSEVIFWPEAGSQRGRPVYIGDKFNIAAIEYKICSMHLRFMKEPNENETVPVKCREACYVLGNGSGNTSGGSRMRDIVEANRKMAAAGERFYVRPRMRDVIRQTPTQVIIR